MPALRLLGLETRTAPDARAVHCRSARPRGRRGRASTTKGPEVVSVKLEAMSILLRPPLHATMVAFVRESRTERRGPSMLKGTTVSCCSSGSDPMALRCCFVIPTTRQNSEKSNLLTSRPGLFNLAH